MKMATYITFSCPQVLNFFMFYIGICATDLILRIFFFPFNSSQSVFILTILDFQIHQKQEEACLDYFPIQQYTQTHTDRQTDRQTHTHTQYFLNKLALLNSTVQKALNILDQSMQSAELGCAHCYVHRFLMRVFSLEL